MLTLTLCLLHFNLPMPAPVAWQNLYARYSGCTPVVTQSTATPASTLPLWRINHFFPHPPRFWPLVDANRPGYDDQAQAWLNRGIVPGVMLPANPNTLTDAQLRQLQTLYGNGAALVMHAPGKVREVAANATLYMARGLPPSAVYLARGYSPNWVTLPPGSTWSTRTGKARNHCHCRRSRGRSASTASWC